MCKTAVVLFALVAVSAAALLPTSNPHRSWRRTQYSQLKNLKSRVTLLLCWQNDHTLWVWQIRSGGEYNSVIPLLPTEVVPIVSQDQDISPDGSFHTRFETGNGISYQEQGTVKAIGNEAPVVSQGSVSYPSQDGSAPIQLTWTADENGFQPQGAHLPVAPAAPEIPPAIARALEWIAAHPYVEPKQH